MISCRNQQLLMRRPTADFVISVLRRLLSLRMEFMNINKVGRSPASSLLACCWPGRLQRSSRTWASISARHVTYRSATAKMAAGDMLESSIAYWKEFNSGDLQVSRAARSMLTDSRKVAKELSLTCGSLRWSIGKL